MTKIAKKNTRGMCFVAALCLLFSASTILYSQQSDVSKPSQKAAPKKKAKAATPSNSSGNQNNEPATSGSGKTASKDAARATKTPVGKETVWVNTATGIYHKKGARYYGKTKEGKYMPEDEAVQAGYKRSKRN